LIKKKIIDTCTTVLLI